MGKSLINETINLSGQGVLSDKNPLDCVGWRVTGAGWRILKYASGRETVRLFSVWTLRFGLWIQFSCFRLGVSLQFAGQGLKSHPDSLFNIPQAGGLHWVRTSDLCSVKAAL
jgi:hypothetical protein